MIKIILNKYRFKNPYLQLEAFARKRNLHWSDWNLWDNGLVRVCEFKHRTDANEFVKVIGIVARYDPRRKTW